MRQPERLNKLTCYDSFKDKYEGTSIKFMELE